MDGRRTRRRAVSLAWLHLRRSQPRRDAVRHLFCALLLPCTRVPSRPDTATGAGHRPAHSDRLPDEAELRWICTRDPACIGIAWAALLDARQSCCDVWA